MGRQVIVELDEVVAAGLEVTLQTFVHNDEDGNAEWVETVGVISAKDEQPLPGHGESKTRIMNYHKGQLQADFNTWGNNFGPLTELFHAHGICYRVV